MNGRRPLDSVPPGDRDYSGEIGVALLIALVVFVATVYGLVWLARAIW